MLVSHRLLLMTFVVVLNGTCWHTIDRRARAEEQSDTEPSTQDVDELNRPCGRYDIKKLSDHFLVTVEVEQLTADQKQVTINTIEQQDSNDPRKPFPTDRLRLVILDGKGGKLLETMVHWSKRKANFGEGKSATASIMVSSELAGRLVLLTNPEGTLFSAPFHPIRISFRSLAR